MIHELKTVPDAFKAVWDGLMTAEFRLDDRPFAVGDLMNLLEYNPESDTYSDREIRTWITHVLRGGRVGFPEGYAMISFRIAGRGAPWVDTGEK